MTRCCSILAGLLLSAATCMPALAQNAAHASPYLSGSPVWGSPYLPGSPVWGSPYLGGSVLGAVFDGGAPEETPGEPVFSPAPGVSCSLKRHACWTSTGIDRMWTTRFFGLKS
jgi:hypothetical protein